MIEKLKGFFKSEKLREVTKKIFTTKKIRAAIAVVVLLIGLKVGFMLGFQVRGTVLKVGTNNITVTNFLGTRTVNLGDYPVGNKMILAGEKVTITKNLSGDVISVRVDGGRGGRNNGMPGRGGRFAQQNGQLRQGRNSGKFQRSNGQNQDGQVQTPAQGTQDGTNDGNGLGVE